MATTKCGCAQIEGEMISQERDENNLNSTMRYGFYYFLGHVHAVNRRVIRGVQPITPRLKVYWRSSRLEGFGSCRGVRGGLEIDHRLLAFFALLAIPEDESFS